MSKSFLVSGNAIWTLRRSFFSCLIAALVALSFITTISVITPALAQKGGTQSGQGSGNADSWAPPIPPDILPPSGKKGVPPKLKKKATCPACQGYLDDLQEALQDWYVLEYEDGNKKENMANNPQGGEDKDQNAIDQAKAQEADATASLGGEKARNAARDAHRQKVNKGNAKTGNKPDPDAGDKDKLAQRIRDLVAKYENCERHPPKECQPPPSNTTPSTPQPPKQPENPPPPPPPPAKKCFPTQAAKDAAIDKAKKDVDAARDEVKNAAFTVDKDGRSHPTPDDDPALQRARAKLDEALKELEADQKADICPAEEPKKDQPQKKSDTGTGTKNDTGTGNNAQNPNISLPWSPPLYPPIVPKRPSYSGKNPYSYYQPDVPSQYVEQPPLPPWTTVYRNRIGTDEAKPGDGCNVGPSNTRPYLKDFVVVPTDKVKAAFDLYFDNWALDDLESARSMFLLYWYSLPDNLKAGGIYLYLDTLSVFAAREAELRADIALDEWNLEDHSTLDILKREFAAPQSLATPNSSLSQPFRTQANDNVPNTATQKPVTSGDNVQPSDDQPKAPSDSSAAPSAPAKTPTSSQTSPSDSGTPGTPSGQTYVPMIAKVFGETPSGQPGSEEPGIVVSLITETPGLPKKDQPRPQAGSGDDPVTGISGRLNAKIKLDEASSLGFKVKDGVVNLSLLRMQSAGTFNLFTENNCCKIDYKSDGAGHGIIDYPTSFRIPGFGGMPGYIALRNSFQAYNGVALQNLPGTNDACLMVFPAPWQSSYAPPPAHSDLPGTAIQLAAPRLGGAR